MKSRETNIVSRATSRVRMLEEKLRERDRELEQLKSYNEFLKKRRSPLYMRRVGLVRFAQEFLEEIDSRTAEKIFGQLIPISMELVDADGCYVLKAASWNFREVYPDEITPEYICSVFTAANGDYTVTWAPR